MTLNDPADVAPEPQREDGRWAIDPGARMRIDTLAESVEADLDEQRIAASKTRDDVATFGATQLAQAEMLYGLRSDIDSLNEQHHRDARAMWWTILAIGLTALAAIFVAVVALNVAVDVANR